MLLFDLVLTSLSCLIYKFGLASLAASEASRMKKTNEREPMKLDCYASASESEAKLTGLGAASERELKRKAQLAERN